MGIDILDIMRKWVELEKVDIFMEMLLIWWLRILIKMENILRKIRILCLIFVKSILLKIKVGLGGIFGLEWFILILEGGE